MLQRANFERYADEHPEQALLLLQLAGEAFEDPARTEAALLEVAAQAGALLDTALIGRHGGRSVALLVPREELEAVAHGLLERCSGRLRIGASAPLDDPRERLGAAEEALARGAQAGSRFEVATGPGQVTLKGAACFPSGAAARDEQHLQFLLDTLEELSRLNELEGFLDSVLRRMIRLAGAERGAILLLDDAGQPQLARALDDQGRPRDQLSWISRTAQEQALETGAAVVVDEEAGLSDTMMRHAIRSLICAPLVAGGQTLGLVYVDTQADQRQFTAADLLPFTALAQSLAVGLSGALSFAERLDLERSARREAEQRFRALAEEISADRPFVWASPAMLKLRGLIDKVKGGDATVLITGPSGTGKSVLARTLHGESPRSDGPFVTVDCGTIPGELFESELFGALKGAFTGADQDREGLVRQAEGGTLFLDEVGELPLPLQVKLLQLIQEKRYRPVGASQPVRADVRILAATNRELARQVAAGQFREDLFYRLSVFPVELPPLAERREDILPLAHLFLRRFAAQADKPIRGFTGEAGCLLEQADWPGNVRELEHRIHRAVLLADSHYVTASDLELGGGGEEAAEPLDLKSARKLAIARFEERIVCRALTESAGNVSGAAERLGVTRQALHKLMKAHGIERARFRSPE